MIRTVVLSGLLLFICNLFQTLHGQVPQLSINRVDQMADHPFPYQLRDWKKVAMGYDSFVYDQNKSGQYLPLIFVNDAGVNYPENENFGLHTYVGTIHTSNGEGINVLPSIVSASLVGIDKSDQWGKNWVLMSQDYFNRNNQELVYLNGYSTHSGNDWWYDVMPNVFFYQIHDLYRDIGQTNFQFVSVADRWLEAVRNMGGSETPWDKAFMDYRAWNLIDMQGQPLGVHQPEASGAIAWLLYNAYRETGYDKYRKGAEWAMEFLSDWNQNPSYELQLPYGAYCAARMNAELSTDYDLEKIVNWVFDRGSLRGWGVIQGIWGGVDVSGLVGEANDQGNDYAFQLNGVQQLGALAPMVRYDKRFANAIGKWALHLASATRYFYPGYLPAIRQDASVWSQIYDPNSFVGYEALREKISGQTGPFSTGDAVKGGWAATNLSLYSSSSIGVLGAIVEKTNVDKILRLDLLATDFYRDQAFPTYLFYNPYSESQDVDIVLPDTAVDIYESLSELIIASGVSQSVTVNIPPYSSIIVVLVPAGGQISYELNTTLIDGVIVDYMQTQFQFNYPPRIQSLAAEDTTVILNDTTQLFVKANDPEQTNIDYSWAVDGGEIIHDMGIVRWIAPPVSRDNYIQLVVTDGDGLTDTVSIIIHSREEINVRPEILEINAISSYLEPGQSTDITCVAVDANGDSLTYSWTSNMGTITGNTNTINWTSPAIEGIYTVTVIVKDELGAETSAMKNFLVKLFNHADSGSLIAHYPFEGDARDVSGNNLHGQVSGAKLTTDYNGRSAEAYFFDGNNDYIAVPNDPKLNFQDGITVSCIVQLGSENLTEKFILSHGSWQNRWKLSITPDQKLRWTIKTNTAIRDLDSDIKLVPEEYYHITATYDGDMMLLYINGVLNTFKPHSGSINPTTHDFLIGQMLPDDQAYNFRGTIDDVIIRDNAVSPEFVATKYSLIYSGLYPIDEIMLAPIRVMPNPANARIYIEINNDKLIGIKALEIIDMNGRCCYQSKLDESTAQSILNKGIDIIELKPGIFMVYIRTKSKNYFQKFMKL